MAGAPSRQGAPVFAYARVGARARGLADSYWAEHVQANLGQEPYATLLAAQVDVNYNHGGLMGQKTDSPLAWAGAVDLWKAYIERFAKAGQVLNFADATGAAAIMAALISATAFDSALAWEFMQRLSIRAKENGTTVQCYLAKEQPRGGVTESLLSGLSTLATVAVIGLAVYALHSFTTGGK